MVWAGLRVCMSVMYVRVRVHMRACIPVRPHVDVHALAHL